MERKPYPGFWQAVLLCVLFTAFSIAMAVPVGVLDFLLKTGISSHPAFAAVVNTLACALTMGVAFLVGRPPAREVFAFRRVGLPLLGATAVATAGVVIVVSELDNLLRVVLPMPKWVGELFGQLVSPQHPLESFFLLVVVAPLTEELLFRGLMLRGMLGRYRAPRAILAVAFLFAVIHLNPWQALGAVVLGTFLGWFYERTRSLLPPLLGHALANGAYFAAPLLPFRVAGFNTPHTAQVAEFQPWWLDGLGVALAAIGVLTFARLSSGASPAEPGPSPAVGALPGSLDGGLR